MKDTIMKSLTRLFIAGLLTASAIGIASSCSEEEDCSLNARPMLNCYFYTINELTNVVERDTLDLLTITALGTDSVIVNREKNVKTLSLPLRYTNDTTTLVFHYDGMLTGTNTDTLSIYQTNTPYFLSMDCGYQMQQSVRSVSYTRHVLDSIYISDPEAGIYGTENLKLFY